MTMIVTAFAACHEKTRHHGFHHCHVTTRGSAIVALATIDVHDTGGTGITNLGIAVMNSSINAATATAAAPAATE